METLVKEKWIIDAAHTEIGFKIKHLMISNIKGNFQQFEASIYTTGDDFMTAEVDCWISASSVNTNNAERDKHLKSADFFDAEKFPQISFVAGTVENIDQDGSYELWGNLTIKGIAKKIKLDVEFGGIIKDPWGNEKAAFTINGKVNRKDWGLNWNTTLETGGILVGEDVYISIEVQLMRAA